MASMIYNMAIVEDRGSYWHVVNVDKNTAQSFVDLDEKRIRLSFSAYTLISQALHDGKQIRINKTLQSDEVTPFEFKIIDTDVENVLADAQSAALVKIRMLVTPQIAQIAGLTMYGFIVLNNDLIDAGYAFTNNNREEKYLEIIETGNEALITKLEDYLKYRDEIEKVAALERKFSAYKQNVQTASTVEEVKKLEEDFLTDFYRSY